MSVPQTEPDAPASWSAVTVRGLAPPEGLMIDLNTVGGGAADLDLLPDAVLGIGADRRISLANAAAVTLLGYPRTELIGASCPPLLDARHLDGSSVWAQGWDRGVRLRGVRRLAEQVILLRARDGRPVAVTVTGAYRRDATGALAGLTVCLRPVRHQADSVSAIEMVSTVSHELRSPLTSIRGYTRLLLSRWESLRDDDKQTMLRQVDRDADRVTRLIGELLDIGRLESGRLVLRRQLVDLPALTRSILDKARLEYPDIQAALTWPEGFPAVPADPDKIQQVLTNLIENACKYASPLGLSISGHVSGGEVAVVVSDRGAGIGADDLPQVFTKFFRRAESRPDGSGLGLWISRGLIELHGGRLTAASIPGEGSVFRFTLPLVDTPPLSASVALVDSLPLGDTPPPADPKDMTHP